MIWIRRVRLEKTRFITRTRAVHDQMFPEAEEVLGDRLERLGTQMQERKQQLTAALK
jgi:hypothetical protein